MAWEITQHSVTAHVLHKINSRLTIDQKIISIKFHMATASTSAHPLSEIRQEIEALFSWNPPRLTPAPLPPNKKPSTSTCPPAYYDKHLSDKLILREVKHLPSLVQDLADNVDAAVVAASETLPPLKGFLKAEYRDIVMGNLDTIVTDEKAVADFYDATTAKFCLPLASTLALHPNAPFSQWRSLVRWTQSGARSSYAIMDGLLRFIGTGDNKRIEAEQMAIADTMENETCRIFEELRKGLTALGTWEMKSTSAGPLEVMTLVPQMGQFVWTHYDAACAMTEKHQKQLRRVAHTVLGPDAGDPPWKLKVR